MQWHADWHDAAPPIEVRLPAMQEFNASDFSVVLPVHPPLSEALDAFGPDIVHSQHPFLLGSTAVRIARYRSLPLVFTHHTLYEQYTHYVPGDSAALKRFTIELATCYANLCDQVFAPSESIRELLLKRGVSTPIEVIPTGVRLENFARGDREGFRRAHDIPQEAFVVGHMGRLAPEKNLEFLARAVAHFAEEQPNAHFLLVGDGPSRQAMDVFAFASKSETQGMVLTEAMAAGLPVIALDASGAREVVQDRRNGRLLSEETPTAMAAALQWTAELSEDSFRKLKQCALDTAEEFSMPVSARKALTCYETISARALDGTEDADGIWQTIMGAIRTELELFKNVARAGDAAFGGDHGHKNEE